MRGQPLAILMLLFNVLFLWGPQATRPEEYRSCLSAIASKDALLVASPRGEILCAKNEGTMYTPASTLKILTALKAIRHLGSDYRFSTEFYLDEEKNLKIKGYGDPLLISEVWNNIAHALAVKIDTFNHLILDDAYFSENIHIPGCGQSTNPFDAPPGALCANFNTVFFDSDGKGRIISAEPQTPMIPYADEKVRSLGKKRGRYTFSQDHRETARYAGELFLHFLREEGVRSAGEIRLGTVDPKDQLIYTYRSKFTLEAVIRKMMEFSNNFVANQLFVVLGAKAYGPPGTLAKSVRLFSEFAKSELGLQEVQMVEGSGISRENRFSALHMLAILKHFKPYRHLLGNEGRLFYKTGTLKGVRTRAGYIEKDSHEPHYFVIFLNREGNGIDLLLECVRRIVIENGR